VGGTVLGGVIHLYSENVSRQQSKDQANDVSKKNILAPGRGGLT